MPEDGCARDECVCVCVCFALDDTLPPIAGPAAFTADEYETEISTNRLLINPQRDFLNCPMSVSGQAKGNGQKLL